MLTTSDLLASLLARNWQRHMRCGEWEAAWRISDAVLQRRRGRGTQRLPRHLRTVWDGRALAGKRVLVLCYHGLGDTLQFIRFAPLLRLIAARVTVVAQPALLPLIATMAGVDAVLPLDAEPPAVERDMDIEIMELPHALRVTLATLPTTVPYIHVAKPRSLRSFGRPRVGLVWQSGDWDPRRSVAPELMQSLTRNSAIHWKVLQRGPALAAWPAHIGERPAIAGIVEEARQLRALDVLVSVDTLSAHLAGALGVRTWTLLPAQADWRWMENREDTPWYPTMRLFRQRHAGEWRPVLERVAAELAMCTW